MRCAFNMILFLGMTFSAGALPADEEVPVDFEGNEEVVFEGEQEVHFDEKADSAVSDRLTFIPEHEYDTWVLVFPLLCLALLAINVRWRNPDREDE